MNLSSIVVTLNRGIVSIVASCRGPLVILLTLALSLIFSPSADSQQIDSNCADSCDNGRGDLNLNGIAWEIDDWILYASFFVSGLAVFDINVQGQIAASDCNNDGYVLTLADIVYLGRVIEGDAPPNPIPQPPISDTVFLIPDPYLHRFTVEFQGNLSALFLIFDGVIDVEWDFPLHYSYVGNGWGGTNVLLIPNALDTFPSLPSIDTGVLFEYSGDARLTQAFATYTGQEDIPVVIFDPFACCVIRGDIDGDEQIDVADLTYAVDYLFAGGPPPACSPASDLDGQGYLIDVADLIYLVDYLFRGGPPPVPCP